MIETDHLRLRESHQSSAHPPQIARSTRARHVHAFVPITSSLASHDGPDECARSLCRPPASRRARARTHSPMFLYGQSVRRVYNG